MIYESLRKKKKNPCKDRSWLHTLWYVGLGEDFDILFLGLQLKKNAKPMIDWLW